MHEEFPSAEEISNIEKKETPELFRASLGFDFVFTETDGEIHCKCIEFNGHDSGILGMADLKKDSINPTLRQVAEIRAEVDDSQMRKRRIGAEIMEDIYTGDFPVSEEGKKKIGSYVQTATKGKLFKHAHQNPAFIEHITEHKTEQENYIPEEYRPTFWHLGENYISPHNAWVLKETSSRGGSRVYILTNSEFYKFLKDLTPLEVKGFEDRWIVQDFIPPQPAQLDEDHPNNPASMRFLIDFIYREDGTIIPEFISGYQRVSPYSSKDFAKRKDGKLIDYKEVFVVNKSRGASSIPASDEEMHMARTAAEAIIQRLADGYRARKTEEDK